LQFDNALSHANQESNLQMIEVLFWTMGTEDDGSNHGPGYALAGAACAL